MSPGRRVLLVSHEASRSGAPRVAVLAVRALQEQGREVVVVTQRPGPLEPDFAALAPTRVERLWRVRRRLWSRPGRLRTPLTGLLEVAVAVATTLRSRCEVVYVNSTSAAAYVRAGRLLRRPVVLHVHESGEVLAGFLARVGLRRLPDDVEVVVCSPSVRDAVLAAGVDPDRVSLVVSVPDGDEVRRRAGASRTGETTAATGASVVVGACGVVEPRKGADLWVEVARRCAEQEGGGAVRFVWVGDGEALPAGGNVTFAGGTDEPYAAIAGFDVMTLPSRDDPFPLVVMEAMLLGRPVVAFDVGGVAHQLGPAGVVVPAGDVDGFARAVLDLAADPEERARLGAAARERAEELFSTRAFGAGVERVLARTGR